MCEQFEVFQNTQLPRIEWIVPDFHGNGVNLKNGGLTFFKFVSLRDTLRHDPLKVASLYFRVLSSMTYFSSEVFLALMQQL